MSTFGHLETVLMDALWDGGPGTVREVADRLGDGRERAYTTVMTTLDRLHRKGFVTREKSGLAWRYAAATTREAHERSEIEAVAREIVRDHGEAGLAAFVDAAVNAKALDRLEALIAASRARS